MRLALLLILSLFLVACSPKVVRVIKEDTFTATFYDTPCKNKEVLSIASRVGVPKPIVEVMKAGEVVFTDASPKRQFCYKDSESGEATFIVDDSGDLGMLPLSPK